MRLEQIEIFLELAKELHFWRTAEKIYITQSALSRQIQALEEELGFALFIRNKRAVKLTAAGRFMQVEWQRLLSEIGNVHRQAKQISLGEIGTLRIGHPGSISYSYLPDLLERTSSKFPMLRFELIEVSATSLDQALLDYQIDIGFNRDFPKNEQLSAVLVAEENFGLFVPRDHWLKSDSPARLADLNGEKFILPSLESDSQYAQELKRIFTANNFSPQTYIESDFGSTILNLINRGLGISIMPASYSLSLPKNVRFVALPYGTSLYAVWRKQNDDAALLNLLTFAFPQRG